MRWMTSRTTMPSSISTSYSRKSPPLLSPRQTRKVRVAILRSLLLRRRGARSLEILERRVRDLREIGRRLGTGLLADVHLSAGALLHHHVDLDPCLGLVREVDACVT